MFREMRRNRQSLSEDMIRDILFKGSSGVLALSGDDDYPYAVPISYVFDGDRIFFHCARSGHKIDAIRRNPKASFCVIGQDHVVPEEYTSHYRSVIVFGTMRIIEEEQEKRTAVEKLALKYAPEDSAKNRGAAIEKDWKPLCMLELTPEHITGKEAVELTKRRGFKTEP